MYPNEVITYTQYVPTSGAGDYIINDTITPENPATVIGYHFGQGNIASEMELFSGSTLFFYNHAKDTPYIEVQQHATGTLKVTKTGNDSAFIIVNYVMKDTRSTTTTVTTNLSYGDILITYFLFLMIMGSIFGFLVRKFIKKT